MPPRPFRVALLMAGYLLAALLTISPVSAAEITDELGRKLVLPDRPGRIIGLTPALTEILFDLDLDGRIVGATTWADHPPQAARLPRVGSYISPNVERIVVLNPDLVLADREGNPPRVVERLEQAGLPVFVTRSDDPVRLPEQIARVGMVCGRAERGRVLAEELRSRIHAATARLTETPPVRALMVMGNRPLICAGPETLHGKLLVMLRADNLAQNAPGHWPKLSLEYVIQARPEVIVVATMEQGAARENLLRFWREAPGLDGPLRPRIEAIDADLITRPGPRLGLGIETLAGILHPDRFPSGSQNP
ncbi:MAG: ABC transporter substrate-binding protein [Proteobacteria bacterium]|nr:ABC transporter substrate-binding protein [Pseudomonadota bacterium]